jgi:hypothetical protein
LTASNKNLLRGSSPPPASERRKAMNDSASPSSFFRDFLSHPRSSSSGLHQRGGARGVACCVATVRPGRGQGLWVHRLRPPGAAYCPGQG